MSAYPADNGHLSGDPVLTKNLLILLFALLLSACGYHLRGAYDVPSGLKNAYLEGGSIQLREQFIKVVRPPSGHFADAPDKAGVIIRIFSEQANNRVLSLNDRGRSNELELYYHVEYEMTTADNAILLARQPLEVKREYFNNQVDILAKDNEQSVIRNEMYQQAVYNIVDRARIVLDANAK